MDIKLIASHNSKKLAARDEGSFPSPRWIHLYKKESVFSLNSEPRCGKWVWSSEEMLLAPSSNRGACSFRMVQGAAGTAQIQFGKCITAGKSIPIFPKPESPWSEGDAMEPAVHLLMIREE